MSSNSPEILVTGASGFIGRAVTRQLEDTSFLGLDRHTNAPNAISLDLSRHKIDLVLPPSIKTIYHFAGQI